MSINFDPLFASLVEADRAVCDVRLALNAEGLMEYDTDDPFYAASVAITSGLEGLQDKLRQMQKDENKWHPGTLEAWRTHGTVIVAKGAALTTRYALDPDFAERDSEDVTHYVWLDGLPRYGGGTGGWVRLEHPLG